MSGITAGVCLHLRSASSQSSHLWIVLSDPDNSEPPEVAMVNLTSHKEGLDETVVLEVGDHPFVRRKTIVNYAGAKIVQAVRLENAIKANLTILHNDRCPSDLLQRIREGVAATDHATPSFKTYCARQF
jgi:hypothetical protein